MMSSLHGLVADSNIKIDSIFRRPRPLTVEGTLTGMMDIGGWGKAQMGASV